MRRLLKGYLIRAYITLITLIRLLKEAKKPGTTHACAESKKKEAFKIYIYIPDSCWVVGTYVHHRKLGKYSGPYSSGRWTGALRSLPLLLLSASRESAVAWTCYWENFLSFDF
jgi:hypothetical protein